MRGVISKMGPSLAAIASGLLLTLAYPPFDQAWIVWVWQAPLLYFLWMGRARKRPGLRGFGLGYLSGFAFFATNVSWFIETGKTIDSTAGGIGLWSLAVSYLALYFGFWGWFAATVGRWRPTASEQREKKGGFDPMDLLGPSLGVLKVAFLNGAAWCALEWIRGWFISGFAWNGLGVALHDSLVLIQCVDIVGVAGLSFLVAFCNVVAFCTVVRLVREMLVRRRVRPHLDFAVAAALVMVVFLYGASWTTRPLAKDTVSLKTLVVQMNIPIDEKWDVENALQMMRDYYQFTAAFALSGNFDLVVWPETAIPGRFTYPVVQKYLNERVLKLDDFYLLTGLEEEELDNTIYNSIILARNSTEDFQTYRKTHLVPFGEYLPLRDSWFPLVRWLGGGIINRDFTPGESFEPLKLEAPDIDIIPLICFEDTMGRHSRKFVRTDRPQLMVNVTNDGWFWETAQSQQHLNNAKFRCIEVRRPMARAANTGVSAIIDEIGSLYDRHDEGAGGRRVIEDTENGNTFIRGALSDEIRIAKSGPITFFARYGDLFSQVMGGMVLIAIVSTKFRRRET